MSNSGGLAKQGPRQGIPGAHRLPQRTRRRPMNAGRQSRLDRCDRQFAGTEPSHHAPCLIGDADQRSGLPTRQKPRQSRSIDRHSNQLRASLEVYPILTTTRPRIPPSTIRRPASMTPDRSISLVIAVSLPASRSDASRFQASCRLSRGHITEFDTDERHPAQNEWGDRRRQIHPAGQPAGGDRAAIAGHRQHVGQCARPDGIDAAGPSLLAKWFDRADELLALDDFTGPQAFE